MIDHSCRECCAYCDGITACYHAIASPSVPTLTTDCVVQDSDIIACGTLTQLFSAMVSGDVLFSSALSVSIVEPLALSNSYCV